jgi:hypothetical protein
VLLAVLQHCVALSVTTVQPRQGRLKIARQELQIPATVDYIRNQAKHHAKRSFAQEWKMFLKKHGLVEEQD